MSIEELEKYSDDVVFRVAQLFVGVRQDGDWPEASTKQDLKDFYKKFADKVAEKINAEFSLPGKMALTRERVYPLARDASRRGFLILLPPIEKNLQAELAKIYPHIADHLYVVKTMGPHDNDKVAALAASLAVKQAKRLGVHAGNSGVIGLGLGPGRATRDFCKHFSRLTGVERDTPQLDLFAISAAGPAREPQYASTSFFNLFTEANAKVRNQYGLFAEALVQAKDLTRIKQIAGVKEAVAERERISLIVTSMGDMNDPHDLLRMFLEESGQDVTARCEKEDWIGNVQYRPYTSKGPVKEKGKEFRAVTLFELEDLAKWSKRDDKYIILIARQCGKPSCSMTRARALQPLLDESNSDSLRVFHSLVMDSATCEELLQLNAQKQKAE